MARGRAATYELQHGAIRDQAARLFAERGFPGTSMSGLAKACGVSKALLYHYYKDKDELLLEIVEGHIDRLNAIVAEVLERELPAEAGLRALIGQVVAEYEHAKAHHRVLVQDIKFLAAADQRRIRSKERRVVNAFAAAVAELSPEVAGARLENVLTMLLFGMINWMFTWFRAEGRMNHEDMADLVTDFMLGGLVGIASGGEARRVPAPRSATARTPRAASPR